MKMRRCQAYTVVSREGRLGEYFRFSPKIEQVHGLSVPFLILLSRILAKEEGMDGNMAAVLGLIRSISWSNKVKSINYIKDAYTCTLVSVDHVCNLSPMLNYFFHC